MITRKAASDMVESAKTLGIIEYYSNKEFRATERYRLLFKIYSTCCKNLYP